MTAGSKARHIENYEFEFQKIFKHEKTRSLQSAFAKKEFNEGKFPQQKNRLPTQSNRKH